MTNKEKLFLLVGEIHTQHQRTIEMLHAILEAHNEDNFIAFDESTIKDMSLFVQLVENENNFKKINGSWDWLPPGFCEIEFNSSLNPKKPFVSYDDSSIPFKLEKEEKEEILSMLEMVML